MSIRLTLLDAAPEEAALEAIRATLRDDPALVAQAVNLWLQDDDPAQDDEPTESQLPCVRLEFGAYPSVQYAENAHKGELALVLRCYSPGVDPRDARRLAHAVVAALLPTDPARKATVKARHEAALIRNLRVARMGDQDRKWTESRVGRRTTVQANMLIAKGTG